MMVFFLGSGNVSDKKNVGGKAVCRGKENVASGSEKGKDAGSARCTRSVRTGKRLRKSFEDVSYLSNIQCESTTSVQEVSSKNDEAAADMVRLL